jgi:hypothetical protein
LIDRIRHDIQQRLDQLLAEADKLRHALAALDPRGRSTPKPKPASRPTAKRAAKSPDAPKQTPTRRRTRAASTANGASAPTRTPPGETKAKVLGALSSYQALTAGEVAKTTGARTADHQHDPVKACEERRGHQGRPWLPPPQHRRRDLERCRTSRHASDRRVDTLRVADSPSRSYPGVRLAFDDSNADDFEWPVGLASLRVRSSIA